MKQLLLTLLSVLLAQHSSIACTRAVYTTDGIDFSSKTGKVMKLELGKDQRKVYSGNIVENFSAAPSFKFLGI